MAAAEAGADPICQLAPHGGVGVVHAHQADDLPARWCVGGTHRDSIAQRRLAHDHRRDRTGFTNPTHRSSAGETNTPTSDNERVVSRARVGTLWISPPRASGRPD